MRRGGSTSRPGRSCPPTSCAAPASGTASATASSPGCRCRDRLRRDDPRTAEGRGARSAGRGRRRRAPLARDGYRGRADRQGDRRALLGRGLARGRRDRAANGRRAPRESGDRRVRGRGGDRVKVAVLRFPGTWSEVDFAHALTLVGAEADILWHADADLRGYDAAIVPGGFTYGDYLRAGAIAAISPAADELRRADGEGMPILGSCNGFQILCEIGLLPGALVRNRQGEFRCDWVHMRIESDRTPFTHGLRSEIARM